MNRSKLISGFLLFALVLSGVPLAFAGQGGATLQGKVVFEDKGTPIHGVTVTILQLRRSVETDDNGAYEFRDVPPGTYDVVTHMDRVPDLAQNIKLSAGVTQTLDFQLRLTGVKEQITVTASGGEELNPIQSVTSLGPIEVTD